MNKFNLITTNFSDPCDTVSMRSRPSISGSRGSEVMGPKELPSEVPLEWREMHGTTWVSEIIKDYLKALKAITQQRQALKEEVDAGNQLQQLNEVETEITQSLMFLMEARGEEPSF